MRALRALIRRIVDRVLGCTPEQVKRRDLYGWSGTRELPPPWAGAEVIDFEPSDEFEMPEAVGIDYIPGVDDNNDNDGDKKEKP